MDMTPTGDRERRELALAMEETWFGMLQVQSGVARRIHDRLMLEQGLSFSAFEVLYRLGQSQTIAVRALAERLVSISPTRVSRVVQDHIAAGLVERAADQQDGRISLLALTAEGQHLLEAATETFYSAVADHFLDALDNDDIAALTRIWAKIAAADCL